MNSNSHISDRIKVDREYEAYNEKWVRLLVDKGLLKPTVDIMPYAKYLMILELNRWLGPFEYAYHINRDWKDDRVENLKVIDTTPMDIEVKYPYDPAKYTGTVYWYKSKRRYVVHLYLKKEYMHDNSLRKKIEKYLNIYIVETEKLNRFLNKGEKVIFKDDDKTNYKIDNLKVIKPNGEDIEVKYPYDPKRYYGMRYCDKTSKRYTVYLYLKNEYRTKNTSKKEKEIKLSINKYIAETEIKYRFLNKDEKVIFKDGDRANYKVDNLEVKNNCERGYGKLPLGPVPFQDYHTAFTIYPDDVYKRSRATLYHKNDRKKDTGMALSRYLVCVDRGEWLPKNIHVHHVDNDIKNDILDNLKIITVDDHKKITSKEKIEKTPKIKISCNGCNNSFKKLLSNVKILLKSSKTNNIFCSRICRSKYIQDGNNIKHKKLITSNCIIYNKGIDIPENGTIIKSRFNPENVPICSMTCVNKYLSKKDV